MYSNVQTLDIREYFWSLITFLIGRKFFVVLDKVAGTTQFVSSFNKQYIVKW